MLDNVIAIDGVVIERGFFPLPSSHPTYRQLCAALDTLNAAISDAEDAIKRQPNPQLACRDAMQLGRLQTAVELIDGCLK